MVSFKSEKKDKQQMTHSVPYVTVWGVCVCFFVVCVVNTTQKGKQVWKRKKERDENLKRVNFLSLSFSFISMVHSFGQLKSKDFRRLLGFPRDFWRLPHVSTRSQA